MIIMTVTFMSKCTKSCCLALCNSSDRWIIYLTRFREQSKLLQKVPLQKKLKRTALHYFL